jgi:hypothetical protein
MIEKGKIKVFLHDGSDHKFALDRAVADATYQGKSVYVDTSWGRSDFKPFYDELREYFPVMATGSYWGFGWVVDTLDSNSLYRDKLSLKNDTLIFSYVEDTENIEGLYYLLHNARIYGFSLYLVAKTLSEEQAEYHDKNLAYRDFIHYMTEDDGKYGGLVQGRCYGFADEVVKVEKACTGSECEDGTGVITWHYTDREWYCEACSKRAETPLCE